MRCDAVHSTGVDARLPLLRANSSRRIHLSRLKKPEHAAFIARFGRSGQVDKICGRDRWQSIPSPAGRPSEPLATPENQRRRAIGARRHCRALAHGRPYADSAAFLSNVSTRPRWSPAASSAPNFRCHPLVVALRRLRLDEGAERFAIAGGVDAPHSRPASWTLAILTANVEAPSTRER